MAGTRAGGVLIITGLDGRLGDLLRGGEVITGPGDLFAGGVIVTEGIGGETTGLADDI